MGVQLPKPPKGAPRNYVVCKDCPACHLKVGNNTRVCRGCGHVFTNVKQHLNSYHTQSHFHTPTINPDGSAIEARKSTRKRTKHNPQNSFDYLDKDEQAHLKIALQNSRQTTRHATCGESVTGWSGPQKRKQAQSC